LIKASFILQSQKERKFSFTRYISSKVPQLYFDSVALACDSIVETDDAYEMMLFQGAKKVGFHMLKSS
jgi:hypothetical protein